MITIETTYNKEVNSVLNEISTSLVNQIKEAGYFSGSISEIILSSDIEKSIKSYCVKYSVPELNISKGREYNVVSKIVSILDSEKIFFIDNIFFVEGGIQIFKETLVSIFADDEILKFYPFVNNYNLTDSLKDVINKCLLGGWVSKLYGLNLINTIFEEKHVPFKTCEPFTNSFKRNVRKALFEYQKTNIVDKLWVTLVSEINYYIKRVLEVKEATGSTNGLFEFEELVKQVVAEIEVNKHNILANKKPEVIKIAQYIRDILRLCEIEVPLFSKMHLNIKKSPISVFNNIIDTETRIVAFIDILGFSALIDEYDNDETSNILNNLHGALELAVQTAIESITDTNSKNELKEQLDYRMFSDCISLSLPFIEYDNDFNIQLNSICTIVKLYQLIMIQKGFYIRGGIAIGSYFSNKNMIFSGGLVKAYKIENKAIHPIVLVSKEIQDRLNENNSSVIPGIDLEDSFVQDLRVPDKIFLNPFETIENTHKNFDFIENTLTEIVNEGDMKAKSNPTSNMIKSLLKLTQTILDPLTKQTKNIINDQTIELTKQNVISELNINIRKQTEEGNLKVLEKLEYFKEFIKWSIDENSSKDFQRPKWS